MSKNSVDKYKHYFLFSSLQDKYMYATLFGMSRYTFKDFKAEYPDDDACLEAVFQNRYGELKFCPHCAAETKFYRVKKRQCYACMHCGHQLHPLSNTIFRKTHVSLWYWFYSIYEMSSSKNGISALELQRKTGLAYRTAWRMQKQIRELMKQDSEKFMGVVEADETYIGGRQTYKQSYRYDNKTPVIAIVEKRGKLKAKTVERANKDTVLPFLDESVERLSVVHTDQSTIYKLAHVNYQHRTVDHGVNTYVKNGVHTNTLEGWFSQLKRSINGTYHSVSRDHLPMYIDEFVFRYNNRYEPICPVLLAKVAKLS